jgi:hypothetical protein
MADPTLLPVHFGSPCLHPEDFPAVFIRRDLSAMVIAASLPAKLTYTVAWVQADEHAFVHYIQGTLLSCLSAHRTERLAA